MKAKGLFVLDKQAFEVIYPASLKSQIESLVQIDSPVLDAEQVRQNPEVLKGVRFIFSGWGCPLLDAAFLKNAPDLEIVFYGAGSVKGLMTDVFWDRGCRITAAAPANAIPVAQYLLSQIIFCLKSGWRHVRNLRNNREWRHLDVFGVYAGSTVGILSLGVIGRKLVEYLKPLELDIVAFDPYVKQYDGVRMATLDEVFKSCDVIACCTPKIPETIGMIKGCHFEQMKEHACFINTARGAIVRENEMLDVLSRRSDITVVLDVTDPEPPLPESPLWTLNNVVMTPHIAGSMASECSRMGRYMLDELKRHLAGEPLVYEVTKEALAKMA